MPVASMASKKGHHPRSGDLHTLSCDGALLALTLVFAAIAVSRFRLTDTKATN